MVEEPGGSRWLPSGDGSRRAFRMDLRPGESPHEAIAGLVGFLQRRFELDVLDYDFTGGRLGTVRMVVPPLPERLDRLVSRCRQTCSRSSELGARNADLRATWDTLQSVRTERVTALRTHRLELLAACARSGIEPEPGRNRQCPAGGWKPWDERRLVLPGYETKGCTVVEGMDHEESTLSLGLVGELDLATVDEVTLGLDRAMPPTGDLELDLSGLTFMGAEGVWLLTNLARERSGVGRVVLADPSPAVRRVIELTGIDGLPNVTVVPWIP